MAASEEFDLKKAWDDACDAFAKTASEDLKTKPKRSPGEVLDEIRAKQGQDEEKDAKYKVAKDVLSKTLDCIDNLGSIAAQGASMVFGPSMMCSNAISFLIDTGARYRNIFTSLTELFSRVSDFLERFKVYFRMPEVDIALRRIINDLLICFVSICGLSIKILKRNKALIYLKVFAFSSDEGVSLKLDELAALVEREREMRGALGYEAEKNIEKSVAAGRTETKEGMRNLHFAVNEMAELEKNREASNVQTKQLEVVKKALDNPSENYRTIYKNFIDKKVEGTGSWLQDDSSYTEWATRKPGSLSILSLAGGEGYGKSFLMSIIVQDLKRRFPQGGENLNRVSIGYYYFQREARGSQTTEKDALSLSNAIKSLAWQLANLDVVYRKEVHSVSSSVDDTTDVNDLWWKLFTASFKGDATFYLLLDGIDQMEDKHVKSLNQLLSQVRGRFQGDSKDCGSLCLRILLSGRTESIERVTNNLDVISTTIDLATHNKDDIEKFVEDGISGIEILTGTSAQVKSLRMSIFLGLTRHSKGDFINVVLILNQIAEKTRPAEILEVLQRFEDGENRSDTIAREVEGLNKSLSQQDITDLNELLLWVISAYRPLTLAELEAVLFVKNGESGTSLQALADTIRDRYSKLFTIDRTPDPGTFKIALQATVSIVSETIEDHFRAASLENDKQLTENAVASGDVNEAEVKIVRRFLETVCDPDLFKKFQFEQFFQNKLDTTTEIIKVDLETANLKILGVCLEVICAEDNKSLEPLMKYALSKFHFHLQQIDLSLTLPDKKTAVGARLLKVFKDETMIKKWWTDADMTNLLSLWLYEDTSSDAVLNWFKDSAAVKGLADEDKKWVKDLTSNSNPTKDLLEHIAKYLAGKWLRDSYWFIDDLVNFIHAYITKIGSRTNPIGLPRARSIIALESLTIAQIERMIEWAKECLGIDKFSYHESRNIARTYRQCKHLPEAIVKFQETALLEEDNWLCLWGLSLTYGDQKNWAMAIKTLEAVIESVNSGKSTKDEPEKEWSLMLRELAQYHKESGNHEKAQEYYEMILEKKIDDFESAFDYLEFLNEKKESQKMMDVIQRMKEYVDETTGLDGWTRFLHEWASYSGFHVLVAAIGSTEDRFEFVKQGYETAIEAAKAKRIVAAATMDVSQMLQTNSIVGMLLFHFASWVYCVRKDDASIQLAMALLEQTLLLEQEERGVDDWSYLPWAKSLVRKRLPVIYIEQACKYPTDSIEANSYLDKIRGLKEEFEAHGRSEHKFALGRYYVLVGKEKECKDALRGEVKTNLDLLSDDDPENDWIGYMGLAVSLMFAGEDEDALAAWSLIIPNELEEEEKGEEVEGKKETSEAPKTELENNITTKEDPTVETPGSDLESKNEGSVLPSSTDTTNSPPTEPLTTPTTPLPNPKLNGPLSIYCDNHCGHIFTYPSDMYICRSCPSTYFNLACKEQVKSGDVRGVAVCDTSHEFLYVPVWEEGRRGRNGVVIGGEVVETGSWLRGVRERWGLGVKVEVEKVVGYEKVEEAVSVE